MGKMGKSLPRYDKRMVYVSSFYLHDWVIFRLNFGKSSIHGASGVVKTCEQPWFSPSIMWQNLQSVAGPLGSESQNGFLITLVFSVRLSFLQKYELKRLEKAARMVMG